MNKPRVISTNTWEIKNIAYPAMGRTRPGFFRRWLTRIVKLFASTIKGG